jgi:prepilin-type N-terminal cleavage/methylation domain-containing protein
MRANAFTGRNGYRGSRGFTLIELLVVVLILAVLMAVSIPLYLSAVADAQTKTCRSNMQTISNAVQAARVKGTLADYSSFIGSVQTTLEADLQAIPICPIAGTTAYTITKGSSGSASTFKVSCSAAGHGTFEPGVDSK